MPTERPRPEIQSFEEAANTDFEPRHISINLNFPASLAEAAKLAASATVGRKPGASTAEFEIGHRILMKLIQYGNFPIAGKKDFFQDSPHLLSTGLSYISTLNYRNPAKTDQTLVVVRFTPYLDSSNGCYWGTWISARRSRNRFIAYEHGVSLSLEDTNKAVASIIMKPDNLLTMGRPDVPSFDLSQRVIEEFDRLLAK